VDRTPLQKRVPSYSPPLPASAQEKHASALAARSSRSVTVFRSAIAAHDCPFSAVAMACSAARVSGLALVAQCASAPHSRPTRIPSQALPSRELSHSLSNSHSQRPSAHRQRGSHRSRPGVTRAAGDGGDGQQSSKDVAGAGVSWVSPEWLTNLVQSFQGPDTSGIPVANAKLEDVQDLLGGALFLPLFKWMMESGPVYR